MPAPVYSAGTVGNVIAGTSLAASKNVAAFLDLSTAIEGQVNCEVVTGGTAQTTGTVFSAYRAYACASASPFAPITVGTGGIGAAGTSLPVSATTGLHQGQQIALISQSTGLGEIVSVNAAVSASPITVTATENAYVAGDYVFRIGQTPVYQVAPGAAWATNSDYSAPMYLGTGQYVVAAVAGNQSVTVLATADKVTSFA